MATSHEDIKKFLRDDAIDHLADTLYDVPAIAEELDSQGLDLLTCDSNVLMNIVKRHRKED